MTKPIRQDGTAIRLKRRERGMKTAELAQHAGVHRNSMVNIEGGLKPASWEVLYRIAHALDCKVSELLGADARRELEALRR